MQLPIVGPAPIVTAHAKIFRDLFENRCQFQHFQNYLTGLIVLDNKSLANITRCVLESADKTNLSRFFSEAPWFQEQVNDRQLTYLLQQTKAIRGPKADTILILDDTLCEHVDCVSLRAADRLCLLEQICEPTVVDLLLE